MTNFIKMNKDFTEDERNRLLEQFETSGLGARDFAREHNINRGTFGNWVWQKNNPDIKRVRHSPVERKKTIEAYLGSGLTQQEFAKAWGVSPATISDWSRRYEAQGADGLMDRPRRPDDKRLGMRVPKTVQDEIIAVKKREPSLGFRSIKNWLYRSKGVKVSAGSIRKTVKQEGLPLALRKRKKRRSSDKIRRFERARPMQLWQSDITQYTLGPSSMRVYLTVFMDDHSRYIVGWRLQSRQTADLVIDAFKDAMVRFGKPEEVLTDQGRQYFAWRGKSDLEKLLEKQAIKHVVSRAHHPQTLGKCERFWETVRQEFWDRVRPKDLEEAKERLKYFIDHYNHQRPHQGIDGQTPADRFFGIAEEVREIIEKTVIENSLRLAVGELPKPPAFLIGQVGDQKIAFHGTSGGFYLTHENLKGEADGNVERTNSVADYAIKQSESGTTDEKKKGNDAAEDLDLVAKARVPGDPGERNLGQGERGREVASEGDSNDNHGGVGGPLDEGPSGDQSGHEAIEILANEPASDGGDDGWCADATAAPDESGGYGNDRARGIKNAAQESKGPSITT